MARWVFKPFVMSHNLDIFRERLMRIWWLGGIQLFLHGIHEYSANSLTCDYRKCIFCIQTIKTRMSSRQLSDCMIQCQCYTCCKTLIITTVYNNYDECRQLVILWPERQFLNYLRQIVTALLGSMQREFSPRNRIPGRTQIYWNNCQGPDARHQRLCDQWHDVWPGILTLQEQESKVSWTSLTQW